MSRIWQFPKKVLSLHTNMKTSKIAYYIGLAISLSTLLNACGIQARIKKADKQYAIGEYYEAAEKYRSAYRKVKAKDKQTRAYVAFQQAECYRAINNSKAANAYKNAIRNNYPDSIVYLHYAQVLHYQGKYKEAQANYQIYLEAHPDNYVAQGGRFACQQIEAWKKQPSRYKIAPAKDFNANRASSFAPAFIGDDADAVMFTSNRTTGNKKNKQHSSITGTPVNALYSTRKNAAGKWEEIEKAEGLADGASSDAGEEKEEGLTMQAGGDSPPDYGICCFTADGKTMYFTYSKPVKDSDQGAKIYVSNRASGTWGEPQEVKLFADSTISCGHPSLSANGDTLYFSSDAPNGFGGKDLYFAESTGDGWGNVTNLGKTINTAGDEMYPTIRHDGTLYFASNGHPGYGGLDIFKAEPQDTTWLLYNMGTPFNSANDDFGITFAGGSENGFFSTNRSAAGQRSKAGFDQIYSFTLPEMVFLAEGNVLDNNGEHISDATLRMVGTDGTNAKVQVRRDGTYKLKLNKDVRYVMLVTARGYLNQKQEINTFGLKDSKTYTQDFTLTPISKPVAMDNIFYEFGKWDLTPASETGLNTLIKLLQDNPNITIELSAHTDRVGNAADNKILSEKRAKSVVDYLIAHGIEKERLTPVGYGKERPVVADKALHDKYNFIPVEQVLDEAFIDSLTPDQQEICNQINRRTEFKVLKTTYKLY